MAPAADAWSSANPGCHLGSTAGSVRKPMKGRIYQLPLARAGWIAHPKTPGGDAAPLRRCGALLGKAVSAMMNL